ncbi:AlpA family transcriptional regulator [Maridesulfovibrio sp.]|jgi:predicted DNA-binding transcriptional regulator AlpA|uniref:helix-turn-helix transcriptional regulator n=1 Tax=Maridesulfovibrio sp. TaxID=2795000 RepID=UPI0010A9AEF3|nr:AlpA family phage regulatory protein [Maridesulfovibrio sp.]TIH19824.1 AlpA family phage regulatory protein [Marinifilum sp. JC120]
MRTESNQTSYHLPNTGFVRLVDVLKVIPVSKTTWWKGIQTGRFPKPVKLTERTTAWRVCDIRRLIDELPNQSEA